MNLDYKRALQQLHEIGSRSFEQAIFAVTIPRPFAAQEASYEPQKPHQPVVEERKVDQVKETIQEQKVGTAQSAFGLKVLFITDSFDPALRFAIQDYQANNAYEAKLEGFFKLDVVELFAKMIKAMGLSLADFEIRSVKYTDDQGQEHSCMDEVEVAIVEMKPQLIITVGATATNSSLSIEERLANVHGKLFNHTYKSDQENFAATIMPLFHPQLLLINPGMKRTAWTDMQKGMKFLNSQES